MLTQGKTEEHFMDRIREWETASQQAYAVSRCDNFYAVSRTDNLRGEVEGVGRCALLTILCSIYVRVLKISKDSINPPPP